MRRLALLLALVACVPDTDDDTATLEETCFASGECIVSSCLDEHEALEEVMADRPACAGECTTVAECDACYATPEFVAWDARRGEASDAWASCREVCLAPFSFDDLEACEAGMQPDPHACAVWDGYRAAVLDRDVATECAESYG